MNRTGTKLLLVAFAAALAALAAPVGASAKTVTTKSTLTFSAPGPNTVPAMGTANLYPWNLFAFALAGNTTSVELTLNGLTHERVSDLDALLVAPNGDRNVMFMSDIGDGTDIPPPGVNLTFKDSANAKAPIGSPLASGTYKPTNGSGSDTFAPPAPSPSYGTTMSRLKGQNPNGLWNLYLTDDDGNAVDPATGSVQSFALKISSQLKTQVVKKKRKKRGCKRFKNRKKRKKCKKKRKQRR